MAEEIDCRYQNAIKNSDKQNARIESDRARQAVIFGIMADNMELSKQFQDNPSLKMVVRYGLYDDIRTAWQYKCVC